MSSNDTMPWPGVAPDDRRMTERTRAASSSGMERLRDVVVRAQVEALGLVGGRTLGRQEDHRHRPPLAQLLHHLDAVDVGHHDVQEHHVGAELLRLPQRLFAALGRDDAESLFLEGDRDELRDPRFVVGDEDEGLGAHVALLTAARYR